MSPVTGRPFGSTKVIRRHIVDANLGGKLTNFACRSILRDESVSQSVIQTHESSQPRGPFRDFVCSVVLDLDVITLKLRGWKEEIRKVEISESVEKSLNTCGPPCTSLDHLVLQSRRFSDGKESAGIKGSQKNVVERYNCTSKNLFASSERVPRRAVIRKQGPPRRTANISANSELFANFGTCNCVV